MIVVIADDLTGAAELAGAAHQRGLNAEVQTCFDASSKADLVAIDTNTRSLPATEAARHVADLACLINASNPAWIYKKTDSVLRGNIAVEIEALLEATGCTRSLFIPANPSKGRLIRNGQYFVNGVPLHETAFAHDPDHPRHTSSVASLLGESPRIHVPDATSGEDVRRHAANLDSGTLPSGGVDFFEALLDIRTGVSLPPPSTAPPVRSTLFVCGSAAAWMKGRASQFTEAGLPLVTLSSDGFEQPWTRETETAFARDIREAIQRNSRVAVAVGRPVQSLPFAPSLLADRLCAGVVRALGDCAIDRICVEGGATGSALLRHMGRTRLSVLKQWAGGVVELEALRRDRPTVVLKVGSYDWPPELLSH